MANRKCIEGYEGSISRMEFGGGGKGIRRKLCSRGLARFMLDEIGATAVEFTNEVRKMDQRRLCLWRSTV